METASNSASLTCDRCGAAVTESDLRQGLAIRIARDIVCPVCVDGLPSDAQLKINQLRAMRGMDSTTYRINDGRRPQTQCYTFSTTSNLLRHRHALKTTGSFDAPLLPQQTRTVSHRHEAAQIADQALRETSSQRRITANPRTIAYAATGAGVLLILALVMMTGGGDSGISEGEVGDGARSGNDPQHLLAVIDDPLRAWVVAREDLGLAADDPLVEDLVLTISSQKRADLDSAIQALDAFALARARSALEQTPLPTQDPRFAVLREQEQQLRTRLQQMEAPPPPPATDPITSHDAIDTAPPPPDPAEIPDTIVDGGEGEEKAAAEETTASTTAEGAEPQPEAPPFDPTTAMAWRSSFSALLLSTPDTTPWEQMPNHDDFRLKLTGLSGALQRSVHLPSGSYRIWIRGHNRQSGNIHGRFGDTTFSLQATPHGTRYRWFPLDGTLTLSEDRTVPLFLTFSTMNLDHPWFLRDLIISDARLEINEDSDHDGFLAVPWTPIAAPPPPRPEAYTFTFAPPNEDRDIFQPIPLWDSAFLTRGRPAPSVVTMINELPWSIGSHAAQSLNDRNPRLMRNDGHHAFIHHPQAMDMGSGTISLGIFPGHLRRQRLELRLSDHHGIAAPHPLEVTLDPEAGWQIHDIRLPEEWLQAAVSAAEADNPGQPRRRPTFDPRSLKSVAVVDPILSNTFPFFMGFMHWDPTGEQAFSPRPRALIRATVPNRNELQRRAIDPNKVRVLSGVHFNDAWRTAVRARLADIIGIDALPNGAVARLQMHNLALDREFIKEYLGDVNHHIVIVMTGGIEFHSGQNRRQALQNFWVKMLDEARRSGFLPVVVLGPTKVDEHFREEADTLWAELHDMLTTDNRFADIPIIDLRSARTVNYQQFAPGGRQRSIDLIADGYEELRARLRSILP